MKDIIFNFLSDTSIGQCWVCFQHHQRSHFMCPLDKQKYIQIHVFMNSNIKRIHRINEFNEHDYNDESTHNINNKLKWQRMHVHTNSSNFRRIIISHKCNTFLYIFIHFIHQKWQGYSCIYTAIGITIVLLWLHVGNKFRRINYVGVFLSNLLQRTFRLALWGIKSSSSASNLSNNCFLVIFSWCLGLSAFEILQPFLFFFLALGGHFGRGDFGDFGRTKSWIHTNANSNNECIIFS